MFRMVAVLFVHAKREKFLGVRVWQPCLPDRGLIIIRRRLLPAVRRDGLHQFFAARTSFF